MKSISQKKPIRKYRIRYELGDPDWGFITRHEAETMATTEAKARANILYRVSQSEAIRIIEVKEIA